MDSITPTPHAAATPTIPLEVSDKQNAALVEDTLNLFSNGLPESENERGLAELARWQEVLMASERPGLAKIRQEVKLLNQQLTTPGTEAHAIAETLASLGAETIKTAEESANDYSPALMQLGKMLIKLGSALSH